MQNPIVLYYSNTGNNKYLANRIAKDLDCPIEEIRPRFNKHLILMLFSSMGISLGIKPLRNDINKYDGIVFCFPIWAGMLLSPVKDFIKNYRERIKKIYFVSCCGSTYEKKDERFGHGLVFKKTEAALGDKVVSCHAFPITLIVHEDKLADGKFIMDARLSDGNFKGEILEKYTQFIDEIRGKSE